MIDQLFYYTPSRVPDQPVDDISAMRADQRKQVPALPHLGLELDAGRRSWGHLQGENGAPVAGEVVYTMILALNEYSTANEPPVGNLRSRSSTASGVTARTTWSSRWRA
jgi:hypothetical protein